jgi:hypothetical protein
LANLFDGLCRLDLRGYVPAYVGYFANEFSH